MIDLHSHILPGLDDGPEDWETTVEMCRMAAADGITTIAATPHIKEGVFTPTRSQILDAVAALNRRLTGTLPLTAVPGADVHLSGDLVVRLKAGDIMLINDKRYLLLELPAGALPLGMVELIFDIRLLGISPILTHPERYAMFQGHESRLRDWVERGLLVQISAMSVTGGFGQAAQRSARRLLELGLVHSMVSDAHSLADRPPLLSPAVSSASRLVGERTARMLVQDVPAAVIEGRDVDIQDLWRPRRRWFPGRRSARP